MASKPCVQVSSTMTPSRAVASGLAAGAVGELAMHAPWFARYRRGGDSRFDGWEFSPGLSSWELAPAPARVGKRLIVGLFQIQLPPRRVGLVSNIMHWGYGTLRGMGNGIGAGALKRPRIRCGLPFGAGGWVGDCVVLPAAKLYRPIWECDDLKTLGRDLSAYLVCGLGTATAFQLMSASKGGI
jgi:hypothetical protein